MLLNPFFGLAGDSLPSDAIAPAGSDVVGNPFQEILQGVQQAQAGGQSSGSGYPSLAELIADVISAASPQSSAEGSQNPGLERHTSGHPHQGQTVKAQIEPEVPIEPGLTNGVTSVSPLTGLDPAVYKTTPTQTELRFSAESNHSGSGSESSTAMNAHQNFHGEIGHGADQRSASADLLRSMEGMAERRKDVSVRNDPLLPAERPEAQFIKSTPLAPESGPIPSIGAVRGSHEGTPSVDLSDQPTPQPTDVEESKVTHQIVRGARFLTREGANQVTLRLDPPELGEVTIRLSSTDKSLTGEIRVESRMVQEIVNRNIGELRESLSSQGIKVEHLVVSVESGGRSGVDRDGSTASHRENADRDRQPASDRHSPPEQRDDQREQSPRQVVRDGYVDFVA